MKVLYAIQGTGNGHISRALEIIPQLQKRCETDILISGYQADIELPLEIKYRMKGLSFVFGKKGGIDFRKTYSEANTRRLWHEINELPVKDYDFILNDFEPVSAWACYRSKVPCIALSHQSSLLNKNVPKPRQKDTLGNFILKNYAPASAHIGFHFSRYSNNIYTPVIRKEIREAESIDLGHYTVYLPAFDDDSLIDIFSQIPEVKWQIFSKHNKIPVITENVIINPIDHDLFLRSLITCTGVLCGAGFETPAESLFLGKKLMVVPMKNQYEQQYNAASLMALGVPVIKKLRQSKIEIIREWVSTDYRVEITFPDLTSKIISRIFEMYVEGRLPRGKWPDKYQMKISKALLSN